MVKKTVFLAVLLGFVCLTGIAFAGEGVAENTGNAAVSGKVEVLPWLYWIGFSIFAVGAVLMGLSIAFNRPLSVISPATIIAIAGIVFLLILVFFGTPVRSDAPAENSGSVHTVVADAPAEKAAKADVPPPPYSAVLPAGIAIILLGAALMYASIVNNRPVLMIPPAILSLAGVAFLFVLWL